MNRTAPSPSLRVLVVDDCADTVESTAILLRMWGHEPITARDGPSALEAAGTLTPDVVLLDVGLPVLDGYQVARKMRQLPSLAGVYVVCLTGFSGEADRLRSLEAGCDDYWPKPVDPDRLRQLLACRAAHSSLPCG